jgi:multiple sugar transport system substrate-binding protein
LGILSYRKDLFDDPKEQAAYKEKYGTDLKPPETWEEYLQIAQFFTRPKEGLWGTTHRHGIPNQIEFDWVVGFFYSRGGAFFDANFNPTVDTPEGRDSLAFFLSPELNATQPPGYQAAQFNDVMQNMVQCKTAMYLTESWAIPLLMDTQYPCGGEEKIAFAPIPGWKDPSGTIHRGSLLAGTGWSINNNISDEQKKMAWEYIKFTTDNARMRDFAAQYGYAPLNSVFRDPELIGQYPWLPILDQMSQVATPRCTAPFEIQLENAIGTEFQKALAGKESTDDALKVSTDLWKTIVHQAGYDDGTHHYNSAADIEAMACKFYTDNGLQHPDCK